MRTLAERLAGQAAVVQVDTEKNPGLAARFGVQGIPVTLLFKAGRVAGQLAGAQPAEQLLAWFRRQR